MNRDIFVIGFMLFALFFGAGNLIYPPTLGIESGTAYWSAIAGFILTGVGLPILAVMAISYVKDDARELAEKVHPLFGVLFTSIIYLAIGPFFGIPRAATVGYEMSIEPIPTIGSSYSSLFIFTTIFFVLVLLVSYNPSKVVDRIGQILTPILLLAIVVLSIGAIFLLEGPLSIPSEKYSTAPFFTGFVEGYLTMDAIAALAFGIIVVNAFKERGLTNQQDIMKSTLKAGIITGIALSTVYAAIGWLGTKMASHGTFTNGGNILSEAANLTFDFYGSIILGIIVTLACFTTSVGLVVAAGQFFSKVTSFSYNMVIIIVTIGSWLIANQGLDTIIAFSVPVLVFIYPIAIVLILLSFTRKLFSDSKGVYRGAILFTALISLYDGLNAFGLSLDGITPIISKLPFFDIGLGWLIPAIIGGLLGALFRKQKI
ncbi:branched-chain amino acid:cation transporter, LIVCS family [Ornithinibacillus halophilus]|uniref:Branched-chain amino acid transport system carrier protein n=1 Tax=Ornithinibacillus halophilus TaxID=930117 RepID=A0A1M5JFS9_9BACI|nr:branched-chain amino acid:cation transporter, LIVCS family [Ornithinibacillus halophilus]